MMRLCHKSWLIDIALKWHSKDTLSPFSLISVALIPAPCVFSSPPPLASLVGGSKAKKREAEELKMCNLVKKSFFSCCPKMHKDPTNHCAGTASELCEL